MNIPFKTFLEFLICIGHTPVMWRGLGPQEIQVAKLSKIHFGKENKVARYFSRTAKHHIEVHINISPCLIICIIDSRTRKPRNLEKK